MLDYSLPGLIGAVLAVAAGLAGYVAMLPSLQRWLRTVAPRDSTAQREDLEFKLGVMRRLMLSIGFVTFGWGGYWLGKTVAG